MNPVMEAARSPAAAYGRTRLSQLGFSDDQIAGIMGSLMQESGLRPDAVNPRDPNGGSFGIFQHNGVRLEALQRFAAERGRDVMDATTQWDFAVHELMTTERRARDRVLAAATRGSAADAWTRAFERPHPAHAMMERRQQYADVVAETWGVGTGDKEPKKAIDGKASRQHNAQHDGAREQGGDGGDGAGVGTGVSGGGNLGDIGAGLQGVVDGAMGKAGNFSAIGGLAGGLFGGVPGSVIGGVIGMALDSMTTESETLSNISTAIDGLFGGVATGLNGNESGGDGTDGRGGGSGVSDGYGGYGGGSGASYGGGDTEGAGEF